MLSAFKALFTIATEYFLLVPFNIRNFFRFLLRFSLLILAWNKKICHRSIFELKCVYRFFHLLRNTCVTILSMYDSYSICTAYTFCGYNMMNAFTHRQTHALLIVQHLYIHIIPGASISMVDWSRLKIIIANYFRKISHIFSIFH